MEYEFKTPEGRAVAAIMEDLRDRRQLKWMFAERHSGGSERIDSVTQSEIRRTWRGIIRRAFRGSRS